MSAAQTSEPDPRQRPARLPSTYRLAELVVHLTDCSPEQAIAAVEAVQTDEPADADASLEVVARAMCAIRRVDLRDGVDLRDKSQQHSPIG
jgi:hypothetical protein